MPFTFKVSDKKLDKVGYNPQDQACSIDEFHEKGQNVYRTSGANVIRTHFNNGFVGAAFQAYCFHYNLSISPDHIWLAIIHAFNTYMNHMKKAEDLRDKFVMHKGKMKLEVRDIGTLQTVDWSRIINQMSALIEKNTREGVRSWLEPGFTTTTDGDKMVARLMMMSVLQKFFSYRVCLMCGIPMFTIEGEVSDWEDIRQRIEQVKEYGLTEWYTKLVPVIDQFVEAAKGKPDIKFWSKICHREGGGSGPTYLGGWLNVFCPFIQPGGLGDYKYVLPSKKGDYGRIDTNDVPVGTCTVPFELDDNGHEMKLEFCCGFFGASMLDDTTLRPSLDWSIRDPTSDERDPMAAF